MVTGPSVARAVLRNRLQAIRGSLLSLFGGASMNITTQLTASFAGEIRGNAYDAQLSEQAGVTVRIPACFVSRGWRSTPRRSQLIMNGPTRPRGRRYCRPSATPREVDNATNKLRHTPARNTGLRGGVDRPSKSSKRLPDYRIPGFSLFAIRPLSHFAVGCLLEIDYRINYRFSFR